MKIKLTQVKYLDIEDEGNNINYIKECIQAQAESELETSFELEHPDDGTLEYIVDKIETSIEEIK